MPLPGRQVPALVLPTIAGGRVDIARDHGANGTLIVFYRGLHCPLCAKQMGEFEGRLDDFARRGVGVVFASADGEDRARQMAEKAGVERLTVAHSMPLAAAHDDWGLYVSTAREGSEEPDLFFEPGIFYMRPDRTLWAAWVQTAPFARPAIDDLLQAIDFAVEKDYPPRGMYDDRLPDDSSAAA